jgi:AcrR family transcriptional regulator
MPNSNNSNGKKDAASEALLEATALLAKEQFQAMPTARDVAKKSGYSVGTLYRYFGSVGGVIAQVVISRQTAAMREIGKVIDSHNPDDRVAILADSVVDLCFSSFQASNPALVRFVFNVAQTHADKPEALNRVVDHLVPSLLAAQARDRTGSFKELTEKEALVLLRGVVYIIRTPLIEGSDFFGTFEHKRLAKDYVKLMFSARV